MAGGLALLGILVPLAIHLWNRRPGRLVQVGSLRWLSTAANRRMRNLKLEQLLLLLLRAAVVAALALAVADPARLIPAPPRHGQILLSPDLLGSSSLAAVRTTVDSLRKQGYELRQLAPGLPRLSGAAWRRFDSLATATNVPTRFEPSPDNLWARVQQAADSLPERPLHVFTLATQSSFRGTRPTLPSTVHWQTVPAADSGTWVQAAYQTPRGDSLRLLLGSSNEAATQFRTVAMRLPSANGEVRVPGLPPLRYEARSNGRAVLQPTTGPAVPVQTAALRLAIYHDAAHAQDAKYMQAALRAASLGLPITPLLTVATTLPAATQQLDWLFWLSDTPVPAAWQQRTTRGLRLWQEAATAGVPTNATLAQPSTQPIRLLRRDTLASSPAGLELWLDGQGQPVLTRTSQGRGATYHLHTRLHPSWSELGSSAELPTLLLPLLQPDLPTSAAQPYDRRSLAVSQILSLKQATAASPRAHLVTPPTYADVRPWVVMLAALLFGLERWLARRRVVSSASATV
ncbi:hypothetical protein BXP70_13200 [Hymenobacter crusticola]|uniref:Aerotolerance regulator N-terminal domain-containing protein n=2 Tax=Hymenobacter crusticola TaxID=1770526 RepID=A0A243WCS3_9BACT|nr:hypothetical protein BXP70_13200 [Hymenobacter crusticola]